MIVSRSLKIIGYVHATLIFALIIPLFYTVIGLSDPAGAGVLYCKCLLIMVPVIIIDRAAKRVRYLAVYLGICVGLLASVWGIAKLFHASGAYAVFYCIGMSAEIFFIALNRLQGRLEESPRRKDDDPFAAKEEKFLDTPLLRLLWYFVVIYGVGVCLDGKALCDMAFGSAIVYLFLALIATYLRKTKWYLETNKRIKGIPARRLYGGSFAMFLFFLILLLIGILPSVLMANHRQYTDIRQLLDGQKPAPKEYQNETELSAPGDTNMQDMLDMMYDGEPSPELQAFMNILFLVLAVACVLAISYGTILAIKRLFRDFRNSRDENGDIIEEINDKERSDREEIIRKASRRTDSTAEKIKRKYRKMIRKHRKDRPAPYESPTEIEEGAGLKGDEVMQELHSAYEEVRYGEQA